MRVKRKIKINATTYTLRCKVYESMNDTVVTKDISITVCRNAKLDEALKVYHDITGDTVIDVISEFESREHVVTADAQTVLNDYDERH